MLGVRNLKLFRVGRFSKIDSLSLLQVAQPVIILGRCRDMNLDLLCGCSTMEKVRNG